MDSLKFPFDRVAPDSSRERPASQFHISEILTLHTGITVISKERTRLDGIEEVFQSNITPLARPITFLTQKEIFALNEDMEPRVDVEGGEMMLDNAALAKENLARQPGFEWLKDVQFPSEDLPQTKDVDVLQEFCDRWVERLAEKYGAWHVLVHPALLSADHKGTLENASVSPPSRHLNPKGTPENFPVSPISRHLN